MSDKSDSPLSNHATTTRFPFVAVVGQEQLKRALLLATIDPRLGGVLIQGTRGLAKTTLARGLADLLPSNTNSFVELPLGTTSDRLTGSIDLQRVLQKEEVAFSPGLFAKADEGVLYIDEVNLLDDSLVDLLLDVAAQRVNRVERDGISHTHSARFILIGTMNPDEGALRPQLSDRFGLSVTLDTQPDIAERVAIVRARIAFDEDPVAFVHRYHAEMEQLRNALYQAQARLATVTLSEELEKAIAQRTINAGVEGVRADIAWRRAAIANTAFDGRNEVTLADIDVVEPMVLSHRASMEAMPTKSPSTPSQAPSSNTPPATHTGNSTNVQGGPLQGSSLLDQRPSSQTPLHVEHRNEDISDIDSSSNQGDISTSPHEEGRLLVPEQKGQHLSIESSVQTRHSRYHKHGTSKSRNHSISSESSIDWFATFSAEENRHRPPLCKLIHRPMQQRKTYQTLVMLDLSASTLSHSALEKSAMLILDIAEMARRHHHSFALLGFGHNRIQWICRSRRPPRDIALRLKHLRVKGGTPLIKALQQGREFLHQRELQTGSMNSESWLITDGRSRELPPSEPWPQQLHVIDSERGRVRLGRAKTLANRLGAKYVALSDLYLHFPFFNPMPKTINHSSQGHQQETSR